MTQAEVVRAYIAAKKLNTQPFPGQTAKKIFMLVRTLQPYMDFQVQEEEKILAKYPDFDPIQNGCKTKDFSQEGIAKATEIAKAVNAEAKKLGDLEITDLKFEHFSISEAEQENIKISGEDIGILEPFITFE